MSTSGCLEMRKINKERKKADDLLGKGKKPQEEHGTVVQRAMLKPGESVDLMSSVCSCTNMPR